jgi:hypothetical protein
LRLASAFILACLAIPCWAEVNLGGHVKGLSHHALTAGNTALAVQTRVNVDVNTNAVSAQVHGVAQQCDSGHECRRWRLERANVHWQRDRLHVTAGRHAISWGNGLIFNPIDVFNPFNPLAIDTEYKPGNNMLHIQYGLANGNDVQGLWVNHGDATSSAFKYHSFNGAWEWDSIVALHREDRIAALGSSRELGQWLWRGEWMWQRSPNGMAAHHLVTNIQRFFDLAGQPASITMEWFHNGWGLNAKSTDIDKAELAMRLQRGELFTPGEDYLALSLNRQMHPLWQLGFTHLSEAHNDSHISQIFSHHDLDDAVQLRIALVLPWRDSRLLDTPNERYLMAQLAWYF